jgi:hypothetical protein
VYCQDKIGFQNHFEDVLVRRGPSVRLSVFLELFSCCSYTHTDRHLLEAGLPSPIAVRMSNHFIFHLKAQASHSICFHEFYIQARPTIGLLRDPHFGATSKTFLSVRLSVNIETI